MPTMRANLERITSSGVMLSLRNELFALLGFSRANTAARFAKMLSDTREKNTAGALIRCWRQSALASR